MKFIIFSFFVLIFQMGFSQNEEFVLWPDVIPNSKKTGEKEVLSEGEIIKISKVQQPTLKVFCPSKRGATGRAVIICPGGGYSILAYNWEGTDIAKWFNTQGIVAFVLKYRLPNSKSINISHEAPLQDVQRAIRLIRFNAEKWGVDKNDIGIIGFSAGGHLASTLGTQFGRQTFQPTDAVDKIDAKPDFMMLIYPVISMRDGITHKGSRKNLLGDAPSKQLIDLFSNELQVRQNTPRTFIVHSADDSAVPVENSLTLYKALKDANIETEMHIYPKGGHGYGLAIGMPHLETWTHRLTDWLKTF